MGVLKPEVIKTRESESESVKKKGSNVLKPNARIQYQVNI